VRRRPECRMAGIATRSSSNPMMRHVAEWFAESSEYSMELQRRTAATIPRKLRIPKTLRVNQPGVDGHAIADWMADSIVLFIRFLAIESGTYKMS